MFLVRTTTLVEGPALDLPHPLSRKSHLLAYLSQGLGLIVNQAKPKLKHAALPRRKLGKGVGKGTRKTFSEEEFVGVRETGLFEQVSQLRIPVSVDRFVDRQR